MVLPRAFVWTRRTGMQASLDVQFQRTAAIQAQIDALLAGSRRAN
jgi:hypothetical protein